MKAILTIGYHHYLFDDEKKAMAAMKALSGCIECRERMLENPGTRLRHEEVIEVDEETCVPRLEIKIMPPKTRIVKTGGQLRLE